MSFSLPAQLTTELKKTGYKPRVGVSIPNLSQNISLTATFSSDTTTYTGITTSQPNIRISVPEMGGFVKVSGFDFQVLNQELYSNLFNTHPEPENSTVTVKLFCDDGTAILESESITLFKGKITDFPSIDYNSVQFQVESSDFLADKILGDIVADTDDPDIISIHDESVGEIKPIIFGDHTGIKNYYKTTLADIEFSRRHPLTPCVFLGYYDTGTEEADVGKQRWLVSGHAMEDIDDDYMIWAYDSKLGRMVKVKSGEWTVVQNNSTSCVIQLPENPKYIDFMEPVSTTYNVEGDINSTSGGTTVSNPQYSINQNTADAGVMTGKSDGRDTGEGGTDREANIWCKFQQGYPIIADDIISCKVYGITSAVDPGPNGTCSINASNISEQVGSTLAQHGTQTNPSSNVRCKINHPTGQGSQHDYNMSVHEVWKSVEYYARQTEPATSNTDEVVTVRRLQIYSAGKGMEYGTWINSRTGGETHANNGANGSLIENYAGVIESLARDFCGIGAGNIDVNQFNVASNDLSTTKAVFSITKQERAHKVIDEVARRARSAVFFDHLNELNMKTFVSTDSFAFSGTNTPGNSDIYVNNPTQTSGSFNQNPIVKDSFKLSKTGEDLVTDCTINYSKDFEGKYQLVSNSTNTSIHSGFAETFNHNYTNNTATAEFWRDHILARKHKKFYKVKFKTFMQSCNVENFDFINVRHPILDGILGTSAMNSQKWLVISMEENLRDYEISIEAVQV